MARANFFLFLLQAVNTHDGQRPGLASTSVGRNRIVMHRERAVLRNAGKGVSFSVLDSNDDVHDGPDLIT